VNSTDQQFSCTNKENRIQDRLKCEHTKQNTCS